MCDRSHSLYSKLIDCFRVYLRLKINRMYLLLENEDPNYQFIVQEWHSGIHFFF